MTGLDRAAIAGMGATRQGAHPDRSNYQLGVDAVKLALEDAGMTKADVDGLVTGQQFDGSGLNPLPMARLLGLEPAATGMVDYSTCAYSLQYAAMMVQAGLAEVVVCVYGRNLRYGIADGAPSGEFSGGMAWDPAAGFYNVAGAVAMGWTQYAERYGVGDEALGRVAVLHRENARRTPGSAWTDPLTLEDYLATPYTVWPFRGLDVARITAGAAAFVVTTSERAEAAPKRAIRFSGIGRQQAPRDLEVIDHLLSERLQVAADRAYASAGLGPDDIDVFMPNDANTAAVLQALEAARFCGPGEADAFVARGAASLGGRLPINPDGGTLSHGYLVGWLHHAEMVRQLRGECGERQVPDANVALYTTPGGFRNHFLAAIYTGA